MACPLVESIGCWRHGAFLPPLLLLLLLISVYPIPGIVPCVVNDTRVSSLFAGNENDIDDSNVGASPEETSNFRTGTANQLELTQYLQKGLNRAWLISLQKVGKKALVPGTRGAFLPEESSSSSLSSLPPSGGYDKTPMVILPSRVPHCCQRSFRFLRFYRSA